MKINIENPFRNSSEMGDAKAPATSDEEEQDGTSAAPDAQRRSIVFRDADLDESLYRTK